MDEPFRIPIGSFTIEETTYFSQLPVVWPRKDHSVCSIHDIWTKLPDRVIESHPTHPSHEILPSEVRTIKALDKFPISCPSVLPETPSVAPEERDITVKLFPRGLRNMGNTCFMNATLQALMSCAPFTSLLKKVSIENNLTPARHPCLRAFIGLLGHMEVKPSWASIQPVSPSPFKPILTNLFHGGRNGGQEDAQEFCSLLLDQLKAEIGQVSASQYSPSSDSGSDSEPVIPEASIVGQKTSIDDLFYSVMCSTITSKGCKPSEKLDPLGMLSLEISPPKIQTLVNALSSFFNPEVLNDFKPEGQDGFALAIKRMTMRTLPSILIIHLKRFTHDRNYNPLKVTKHISFPVDFAFPAGVVDAGVQDRKYELVATVTHVGKSVHQGHYTANVKHGEQWTHCDDSRIVPTVLEKVLQEDAYLLVYKRM